MAVTRKTLRKQVQVLVGYSQEITEDTINDILQAEDAEILEAWAWTRRRANTLVNTMLPTSVAVVTVTNGSSTILSANFTADMVGKLIRLADTSTFYQILSVVAGVSAVIGGGDGAAIVYPDVTQTLTATLFQYKYTVSVNAERVLRCMHNVELREMDSDLFDRLDPERITTGDPPEAWAHLGRDGANALQIGFFPVPAAARSIRVDYLKVATMTKDTDVTYYHPSLLKLKAGEMAAVHVFAKTGDQAYTSIADRCHKNYDTAYQKAIEDDLQKSSAPTAISPEGHLALQSDEFGIAHDTEAW